MKAINPNLIRWLDGSVINYLTPLGLADSLKIIQPVGYSIEDAVADAVVYTDTWSFTVEPTQTNVSGSLVILIRDKSQSNIYSVKSKMGKVASYLSCLPVHKFGKEIGDDETQIGNIEVQSSPGIRTETRGYIDGKVPVIQGVITCELFGTLTGV